ncbi:MAG TPA: AAA family ATPase [Caulobacteraceae bacterium]|nr:AAA family ATPase [Caulobacteraceae bacterium]
MHTVAVIALKGGSGKTTVAMHMALAAHWRGLDSMVVDIDPQASASDILSAREEPGPAVVNASGPKLLAAKFAAVGLKKDLLIVDTAAGAVEDVTEAVVLSDYVVLVVRPTLIDIAGLVRSFRIVRRLAKPCAVVVNQAPVAREGTEAPLVRRALRALDYMGAPLAPTILRSRAVYQTALERGRSVEEMLDKAAAREAAALWAWLWSEIQKTPADGTALAVAEAAEEIAENLTT